MHGRNNPLAPSSPRTRPRLRVHRDRCRWPYPPQVARQGPQGLQAHRRPGRMGRAGHRPPGRRPPAGGQRRPDTPVRPQWHDQQQPRPVRLGQQAPQRVPRPSSALRRTFLGCSREDTLDSPSPTVRSANACTESGSGPSRTVPPLCSLSRPKSSRDSRPDARGPHQGRRPVAASISRGLGRLRRRRQPPIKHRTSAQSPNHAR